MTRRRELPRQEAKGPRPFLELGTRITDVTVLEQEGAYAVEGLLVFARRGRHLVLIDEAIEEPMPPSPKVRRPFTATLRERGGRTVLESLEIRSPSDPDPDEFGVTTAVLRATRPEAIIAIALRGIRGEEGYWRRLLELNRERWEPRGGDRHRELRSALESLPAPAKQRGGRRPLGDEFFEAVALHCLALYEGGVRRGITRAVAEQLAPRVGYQREDRTVEDWIRRARRLGYLAPGRPGEVWFGPGPRLSRR